MKRQLLVVTCCLVLSALSLVAQSGQRSTDVISGTWSGDMGRSATDRMPITFDMKFDGKTISGKVTGPPTPGVIKTGTFDRKTGALKIEVNVGDSGDSVFVFEGTVVKDTASGKVTGNGQTGDFKMTKK